MRSRLVLTAALLVAMPAGARASDPPSALAVPAAEAVAPGNAALLDRGDRGDRGTEAVLAGVLESIRFRPRERSYHPAGPSVSSLSQVHAGFFDPNGDFSTGFLFGARVGPQIDPHIQLGIAADWWHKSESQTVTVSSGPLPGGGSSVIQRELSRSSSNLFPILGFLQISGDEGMPIIPYGGVGAGYEALFLSADDRTNGTAYDATFGGFGWQAWGGVAVPLSGRSRISGELFVNDSDVERSVDSGGQTYREIVKMSGVGMRFGLTWGL